MKMCTTVCNIFELLHWETSEEVSLFALKAKIVYYACIADNEERRESLITILLVIFRYCPWCSHQHW